MLNMQTWILLELKPGILLLMCELNNAVHKSFVEKF